MKVLLLGIVPGVAGAGALVAAWWLGRRSEKGPVWLLPILLALAVAWADAVGPGKAPSLWPRMATDRVPHAAVLLALASVVLGVLRLPALARLGTWFVVTACATWMVFGALYFAGTWTWTKAGLHVGGMTLIATLYAALLDRPHKHERGLDLSIALFFAAHAAALVILQAAVARHAMIAGSVTAILGSSIVTACVLRKYSPVGGGVGMAVAILVMLVGVGHSYSPVGIPPAQLVLLAVTPLAVFIGVLPPIMRLGRWKRAGIVALVAAATSGPAIGLALASGSGSDYPY